MSRSSHVDFFLTVGHNVYMLNSKAFANKCG